MTEMPYGILTAIMLQVTTPSRYLPVFLSKIETEELQHLFQLLDRVVSTGLSRELNVPFTGLDILNSEDVTESSLPRAQSIAGAALQTVRSLFQISQSLPSLWVCCIIHLWFIICSNFWEQCGRIIFISG